MTLRRLQALLSAGQPVVCHCRRDVELVDWAKERGLYIYCGRPSMWGNPYTLRSEAQRQAVIVQYEAWLGSQPHLIRLVGSLRGRLLGCWCAPKACHCDVLARLALAQE